MQRHLATLALSLITLLCAAQQKDPATLYVDRHGVMRRSDTRDEASFFGVNYTLPFAHAYRAMGYLGKDRKAAIDKDVYHFARLGFNAYRIHIWDVEISDREGNLIANDHLDLLDYLIYKVKERNISVVLTAMTNFGNGYPERNRQTGGFSYAYDKCEVHSRPEAIRAQERYIAQLVRHVNPYTGKAYRDDPAIVGFEINNEPCHAGTRQQTRDYINRMLAALRKAGNRKPVFYNVSHNGQQIEAYYSTAVEGTTYQWYPIGLVAGHTRRGNFLPYTDSYPIPFDRVKGFAGKARLVYEYDPADITYSYMHPAMARTFRTAGFQWITQFAYDPMDMAWANTEYQTHFLNLAYTPQKAISMKIAAEVAYAVPRNRSYGVYPNDTVFEGFRVSYRQDLSEMNTPEKFFHSNHTATVPVATDRLKAIAGTGNSPVVQYEGTGAYFIDRLEDGVWRLEVMPDALPVSDPFARPSLKKAVVTIARNSWDMTLRLPQLQDDFTVTAIDGRQAFHAEAARGVIKGIRPGVYLLQRKDYTPANEWTAGTQWNRIRLGEYAAPEAHADTYSVFHKAATVIESGAPLTIEAQIAGPALPDSVMIYTDRVSFWNNNNPSFRMESVRGYTYRAVIPGQEIRQGKFRYTITVCRGGEQMTFPAGAPGNPADWDYTHSAYWESAVTAPGSAVNLFTPQDGNSDMEVYTMPEWSRTQVETVNDDPVERPTVRYTFTSGGDDPRFFLRRYIRDDVTGRRERPGKSKELCLYLKDAPATIDAGFVTNTGYTYTATLTVVKGRINKIPLSQLQQTATALLPHPYPVFLKRYFEPETAIPFRIEDIEQLEISFGGRTDGEATTIELGSVYLE
jgi:hypothetical protein